MMAWARMLHGFKPLAQTMRHHRPHHGLPTQEVQTSNSLTAAPTNGFSVNSL